MTNIEYANVIARTARATARKIIKKSYKLSLLMTLVPFLCSIKAYLREGDLDQPSLISLQFRYH